MKEGRVLRYGHAHKRVDGATAYGHTTPKRPTPSYLKDYHNDIILAQSYTGGQEKEKKRRRERLNDALIA